MSSRNGKIAKLPIQLREQLNVRISEGATLKSLLGWLNNDPAVLAILNTHFCGRLISQQNMSEWRLGGYEEWLTNQEYFADARAFAERRKFLDCSGISAEDLLGVITARWARLMDRMGEMDIDSLNSAMGRWQNFTKSAAILRKLELQKARLELDRETRHAKGEKKDPPASLSLQSTAASESVSSEAHLENSVPSHPASGDTLFCPGVPCHPDELIELQADDMTEEEDAWQALWDPPAPPPKPAPVDYSGSHYGRGSVPDAKPVATDSALLSSPSSGSSPKPAPKPTLTERIQAALEARIEAGEDTELVSDQSESTNETAPAGVPTDLAPKPVPDFGNMRSKYGLR